MSNPITIKDIGFTSWERGTVECWVGDGESLECLGTISKFIPRGITSRRNSAGPQNGPHQWLFIYPNVCKNVVLNVGGNLRQAKKQALEIIISERA